MLTRCSLIGGLALLASGAIAAPASAAETTWELLQEMLFEGREIHDGSGLIALEAPKRAHDAALVPITIEALIPQSEGRYIQSLHLIVDENPAPIAGIFRFHPESGRATISTRIRVNAYSDIHVVAETSDGQLHMVSRFIKAAGGCSTPGLKDKDEVMARLGKMKLKPMTPFAAGDINQAQLLISHPNYTGMQMETLTRYWIPPDYVTSIEVRYGDIPILEVEGDIALSEDPSVTFSFVPEQPGELSVVVGDSEGRRFESSWPVGPERAS